MPIPARETPAPPRRVAASVALALAVFALGSRIPLPGLDAVALATQMPGGAIAGVSIFALGVMPLFNALACAEIVRLAFPPLAAWQAASARNAGRMSLAVGALALVLAAMQGYGIIVAMDAAGLVADPVAGFAAVAMACFVGSTALLAWLADRVRLPQPGHGFWLLLAIPFLAALPGQLATWAELTRLGAASFVDWLLVGLFLAAATALVVVANSLLSGRPRQGRAGYAISQAVLLWPPFLAGIVAGYVILLPSLLAPELALGDLRVIEAALLAAIAVLIPLFVYAYARILFPRRADAAARSEAMPVLLAVAGIQVAICVGAGLMNWILYLPMSLNGGLLIALVTVMLALRNAPAGAREGA